MTDSKWLNQPVANPQGETLGKITKVLKDEKTQNIEYVMFQIDGNPPSTQPLPFSRFQEKGDKLVINATKAELLPNANRTTAKDMSPDLAMYMEEIEHQRAEPKASGGGNEQKGGGDPGTLSGAATLGEDKVGSHRAAPPTPAPGFENDAQKAKK